MYRTRRVRWRVPASFRIHGGTGMAVDARPGTGSRLVMSGVLQRPGAWESAGERQTNIVRLARAGTWKSTHGRPDPYRCEAIVQPHSGY